MINKLNQQQQQQQQIQMRAAGEIYSHLSQVPQKALRQNNKR